MKIHKCNRIVDRLEQLSQLMRTSLYSIDNYLPAAWNFEVLQWATDALKWHPMEEIPEHGEIIIAWESEVEDSGGDTFTIHGETSAKLPLDAPLNRYDLWAYIRNSSTFKYEERGIDIVKFSDITYKGWMRIPQYGGGEG